MCENIGGNFVVDADKKAFLTGQYSYIIAAIVAKVAGQLTGVILRVFSFTFIYIADILRQ